MPGANDSASGVAALIELARVISQAPIQPTIGIDFVFFDGEEGDESLMSDYSSWKPLGSTFFADNARRFYGTKLPKEAIVVDMVCDKDLMIKKEPTSLESAPELLERFFTVALRVAPDIFSDEMGGGVRDDHTSLNAAGIPSILLIDLEYPPFHTTEDTADKCSGDNLAQVVRALHDYVYSVR